MNRNSIPYVMILAFLMSCVQEKPAPALIQLTNSVGDEIQGHLSQDGKLLVYQFINDGGSDIWIKELDGGESRPFVATELSESAPRWSPDGQKIVYFVSRDGKFELWTKTLNTDPEPLFQGDSVQLLTPDWSPDGRFIVATGRQNGLFYQWVLEIATKEIRRLTDGGDEYWGRWSPVDNDIIYFTGKNDSIVTVNSETGKFNYLSKDLYAGWRPVISPRNDRIAFVNQLNQSFQIWLANRDGSEPMPLTSNDFNNYPSWSPEGDRLLFSKRVEDEQLYELDLSTGNLNQITNSDLHGLPAVSKTGKLAYVTITGSGSYPSTADSNGDHAQIHEASFVFIENVEWMGESNLLIAGTKSGEINRESNGLYLFDLASGALKLLDAGGGLRNPEWIHGTNELIYCSAKVPGTRSRQLIRLNIETGEKTILTTNANEKFVSDCDVQGKYVLYSERTDFGGNDLIKMDLETGKTEKLLVGIPSLEGTVWSLDGSKVAFRSRPGGQFDLSVLDLASGEINQLTNNVYKESPPQWSPGGDKILFSMNANDLNIWSIKIDN